MTAERILLVDDDAALCETLAVGLGRRGIAVRSCGGASEALEALARGAAVDAVVTDLNLPGETGIALCGEVARRFPDVPVVVLTAFGSLESAVEAIRAGAYDFISKPIELEPLALAIHRALDHRRLREEVRRLRTEVARLPAPSELVGDSEPMRRVRDLIARVADSDVSVLVTGESGTGKELVARALHAQSRRAGRPFVAVSCAAIPEALLEAELFGHVRGAYTDAREARSGLFVQASGGTLLLDEIGDMPSGLQPKLLRVLQERRVRPLGGAQEIPVDVRIVAATHHDLEDAIEERRFREDLYFRINVVDLELPPLRARGADVLVLAQQFLARAAARTGKGVLGLSTGAAELLVAYAWPGNVRELQNCMERAVALARLDHVAVDDLPERVQRARSAAVAPLSADDPALLEPMDVVESRYVAHVMRAVKGNKAAAARVLGFDRKRLARKLAKMEGGAVGPAAGRAPPSSQPPSSQ